MQVRRAVFGKVAAVVLLGTVLSFVTVGQAAAHPGHPVDEQMQEALEAAPDEVDGRCVRTMRVQGIGPACATEDGLFRVREADGTTFTTHGADAPADALAASYSTGSAQALDAAGPADIHCVTPGSTVKHTELVYSHPADQASRYATVAPQLVQEAYKASAFMRAESRAVAPAKGVKLILACDANGTPIVHEVRLPTAGALDTFSTIVADLKAQGYASDYSLAATDRLLVFHDSPAANGAAGTGHLYRDDRATADNASNRGGLVAVEYAWSGRPHWDVLLHELAHNMGAVQRSAANSTEAGHCNDGTDVMCYADGSADSVLSTTKCSVEVLDCGRDDYFNPAPAADSYLATHWNVASSVNRYLLQTAETVPTTSIGTTGTTGTGTTGTTGTGTGTGTTGTGTGNTGTTTTGGTTSRPGGGVAPTRPGRLRVTSATATSIVIAWGAAKDDVAVTGYRIERRDPTTGRWATIGTTDALSRNVARLRPRTRYVLRVAAIDDAGNRSAFASVVATTAPDTVAPSRVQIEGPAGRAKGDVTLRWRAAIDNVAVTRYDVYQSTGGTWKAIGTAPAASRTLRVVKLTPGTSYRFQLRARDAAGNMGPASQTVTVTP